MSRIADRGTVAGVTALAAVLMLSLQACGGGGDASDASRPLAGYDWQLPPGFPTPQVHADRPLTAAKVELGRQLFYDPRTSNNGEGSCASCHEQRRAFTDGRALATGPTGEVHARNAMSLTNVVYNARQNWANPLIDNLREQAIGVLLNEAPIELGWAGQEQLMLDRLRGDPAYVDAFMAAFPEDADPFSLARVAEAYEAFMSVLISGRSAYDRATDPEHPEPDAISDAAWRGEALFFSERLECFHCHGGFNFAQSVRHDGTVLDGIEFRNNGLYNIDGPGAGYPLEAGNYPPDNQGLFEFTENPNDMGRFRAPTLRNIALTAPYMHDGSIATLREVIVDHYARGGRVIESGPHAGDGSGSPYKDALMVGFMISDAEVDDLLAFLDSLTDWAFVCDPGLADPEGRIPMHTHCAEHPVP